MRSAPLLLFALLALASCKLDHDCFTDADCTAPGEACRRGVFHCAAGGPLVTVGLPAEGRCREQRGPCATDDDCVEDEICRGGFCRPGDRCPSPQATCPPDCPWGHPYPCACVCAVCPGADGGVDGGP